jgi:outer membrane protein assembly factor BamB
LNTFNKKTMSSTIAMFLIISMAITLFALPNFATAQTVTKFTTYPFVEAIPNPVGVGQRTLINFGLLNYLNVDGDGWNVTLTITAPDGTVETIDRKTWSTGTVGYSFTPETNGTYILQTHFEETSYNYTAFSYVTFTYTTVYGLYLASESAEYKLVVQNDAVPYYPGQALPSEYWSRPIDSQFREWYSIAGSWLAAPANLYAPYNDGPESAHILWTMPVGDTMGGLAGGNTGEHAYGTGDAYEGKWAGSVIISGVLYYNKYTTSFYSTSPKQEVVAVDLHTGKTLWSKVLDSNGRIAFGQVLYWDCLNYRGAFSYLWVSSGSSLYAFEALTGDWLFNYTNVPSGTNYFGPNGEILRYSIKNFNDYGPDFRLVRWNSSYAVTAGTTGMAESWGSQIQGISFNCSTRGYDLNKSISALPGSTLTVFPGDRIIGGNVSVAGVTLWSLSLKEGSEGALLFSNTWAGSTEWQGLPIGTGMQNGWAAFSAEDNVAVYWTRENRVQWAFSLETGAKIWQTEPQDYKDAWSDTPTMMFGPEKLIAYGKFYSTSLSGTVYCYDVTDGKLLWNYNASDPYTESYIGNNWWLVPTFITDGKIYVGHMEHSALDPKPRGAPFICLNATDGSLIWEIDGAFRQTRWGGRAIIGDSIIATMDTYDQRVYAIGKGPSAISVSAPDTAVAFNAPVMIKGSVTDVSPGTEDEALKLRFPDGVPAVSDDSMSEWMLYVYKQFSRPTNATGVAVSLDALDPNGNFVHIGDTTSDASGTFSYMFTPQTAGKYTIYATFIGSKSYYASFAQTAMGVQEAVQPTATPTAAPKSITEEFFVPAVAGIIATIAIVGVLLAILTLRKHP